MPLSEAMDGMGRGGGKGEMKDGEKRKGMRREGVERLRRGVVWKERCMGMVESRIEAHRSG